MTTTQKAAAQAFAAKWQGIGDEKQHTQTFWLELLHEVYGVAQPFGFITFEDRVKLAHTSFIDARIPETHVIIEQKSLGKDLSKPIKQSDGTTLTPYQQAKRYANEQPQASSVDRGLQFCRVQGLRHGASRQRPGNHFAGESARRVLPLAIPRERPQS